MLQRRSFWNKLWRALVLVCAVECVEEAVILSPEFSNVLENSSLMLTCHTRANSTFTIWGTLSQAKIFSYLSFSKEGTCETDGFLSETKYFETRCYSNATFFVIIKRVNISYHGQKWFCSHRFDKSNIAFISVQVPTKYVVIKNISSNSIMTVENIKTTLVCITSEGRPAANITWTKISKNDTRTDLTKAAVYNISRKETVTDRNLTIVTSSIDIELEREDNGGRIICEATNLKSYIARKEITIVVQYPPRKPIFQFIGQNALVKNASILSNKLTLEKFSSFTVLCKADGNPSPTCTWTDFWDIKSSSLTFTNISKDDSGFYTCFAENKINGNYSEKENLTQTSSILEINVQYPSSVVLFYLIGLKQNDDVFEVTENETIIFNCSVDSNPESLIYLSFREKELKRKVSTTALFHTHLITSCFDDGVYKCTAGNSYNIQASFKELKLHVRCTPRVSPEFKVNSTRFTTRNDTVTFEFEAVANPSPVFTWYKLDVSVWSNLSTNYKYKIDTTGLNSKLSVTNISEEDFGHYKLEIRNDIGFLEQLYYLKAKETEHQDLLESPFSISRLPLLAAGSLLGAVILVAVLVFICYRQTCFSQDGNTRQLADDVIVHQSSTSDDNNITMYEDIDDMYEHLNDQFKERDAYIELEHIEKHDSYKDYLTPIP